MIASKGLTSELRYSTKDMTTWQLQALCACSLTFYFVHVNKNRVTGVNVILKKNPLQALSLLGLSYSAQTPRKYWQLHALSIKPWNYIK